MTRWLVFSSSKAGAVELLDRGPRAPRSQRIWWRFRGDGDWYESRSRFEALLHAAWMRGLRGIDANFCCTRERTP